MGVGGQYVSDVIGNISRGEKGLDIFKPTSSATDYFAAGVGGAIAAIPGLGPTGTLVAGALGSVATDTIKGDINNVQDLTMSALKGASANGIGFLASKQIAISEINQIRTLPRTARKIYLRDEFYINSQAYANQNLQTFELSTLSEKIQIIEMRKFGLRSGFYSTTVSTGFSLLY